MPKIDFKIKPDQLLLLKAAIFPREEAIQYWEEWKMTHQLTGAELLQDQDLLARIFDPLDSGSYRLMPLVYRNLEAINDPLVKRMRGMYRHSWIRNQQHLFRIRDIVQILHESGIEAMLIKGLAMSLLYYKDLGVRYMNDVDVLVPYHKRDEALQLLTTSKLNIKIGRFDYYMRSYYHASHLYSESGYDLDLHHHLLAYNRTKEADATFWSKSSPFVSEQGIHAHVLSPTHQLFHNIVHGNFPDFESPMRWVADCYVIYTNHEIDWVEILRLAEEYRLAWPIKEGLKLLISDFKLVLPEASQRRYNTLKVEEKEEAYRHFLYETFHKRKNLRKYYTRARYEHELYFNEYSQQPFMKWFFKKTVARTQALLFDPTM